MVLQLRVGLADDCVSVGVRLENEHCVNSFFCAIHRTDDRGFAHARLRIKCALDVLGKDVQPVGPHDHFLLAAFDEQATLRVALADVAGVQPAVGVEDSGFGARGSGFGPRAESREPDMIDR